MLRSTHTLRLGLLLCPIAACSTSNPGSVFSDGDVHEDAAAPKGDLALAPGGDLAFTTPDLGGGAMPDIGTGPTGTPITAPADTWTWIDVPEAKCDDGTPTGIGVRLSSKSKNVLVYMTGGGACWDYLTCFQLNTSVHGPFGALQWTTIAAGIPGTALGEQPENPFRDWTKVYVPYCTGDLHAGNNVATYLDAFNQPHTMHHVGHQNFAAFMSRIAATVPLPDKFVLAGSSAGGFGAAFNYDFARTALPHGQSYLVDDAGPTLVGDAINGTLRAAFYASWKIDATLGALCPGCTADLSAFIPILAAKYPKDRMALLSSEQDMTIRTYFQLAPTDFQTALYALGKQRLDPTPGFRYYFEAGQAHTMLGNPLAHSVGGVGLPTWIAQMVTDDAAWKTVHP